MGKNTRAGKIELLIIIVYNAKTARFSDRNAGFITPLAVNFSNDNFLMRNCSMITQSELKELFRYDPETGLFTRLVYRSPNAKIGYIAGTIGVAGYIQIKINMQLYQAHRLSWLYMTGEWPENDIDHENHKRSDNRWKNLREVTRAENLKNKSLGKNNTSDVMGVHWEKSFKKWTAYIAMNNKRIFLGRFFDKFEAICRRKSAENKHNFHENHGS